MLPEISMQGGIPTLMVDGRPFFARAGEIHNSSASSLDYMEREVWPNFEGLNMNAVVLPIYWETIEPEEGKFCFDLLDGILQQARARGMRLVLLWFGLWKNSRSTYVPAWVKTDTARFFLVEDASGMPLPIISPFCAEAVACDARAFAQVMAHLGEVDGEENTVILMQVENEIGVLDAERDFCPAAQAAFSQPVPAALAEQLGVAGTWQEAFGADAGEALMAWAYASAVEQIASAGRAAYPLPCYVNSWLKQYPWYPGSYPMGGPVPEMHAIWRATAPSIAALAPDIYVPYAAQTMDAYHKDGNPLVIPEIRKDAVTASYALYAFLHHDALCYSPFGIEELALPPEAIDKPSPALMEALNIDPAAMDTTGSFGYLSKTYALLAELEPLYLAMRGTEHLKSFVRRSETDFGAFLQFGSYDLCVAYSPRAVAKPVGAGAVFELDEDTFLLTGMMCRFQFRTKPGTGRRADFISIEEGEIKQGQFIPRRIYNGDERMQLRCGDNPTCLRVKLYSYDTKTR